MGTGNEMTDSRGRLQPNSDYQANGYTYHTDQRGRVAHIDGQLRLELSGGDTGGRRVAGVEDHREEAGGSVISSVLAGAEEAAPAVSINIQLNIQETREIERKISLDLGEGKEVRLHLELSYRGDAVQPDAVFLAATTTDPGSGKSSSAQYTLINELAAYIQTAGASPGLLQNLVTPHFQKAAAGEKEAGKREDGGPGEGKASRPSAKQALEAVESAGVKAFGGERKQGDAEIGLEAAVREKAREAGASQRKEEILAALEGAGSQAEGRTGREGESNEEGYEYFYGIF